MSETSSGHSKQNSKCLINDSVGFVTPNQQLRVVDDNGKNLGPNQPGELYIKHPVVMLGYLKNPEETKKVIDEDGWVHSRDLVSYRENGEFIYHERIKEIIKFRGNKFKISSPVTFDLWLLKTKGAKKSP